MLTPVLRRTLQTAALLSILAGSIAPSLLAQQSRISPVVNGRRIALPGHIHPRVALSEDHGRVETSTPIPNVTLTLAPTAEQQAALDELLLRQQTPGSADYHHWLSPEQYAERFGVSEADLGTLRAWLESQGLTINSVARSRTWISFSGAAGQIETAFQTELHQYLENGETHIANASEPSIPERFSGVVRAIRGLNDFRPRPFKHTLRHPSVDGLKPAYTSSRGNHYIAPTDLATIYNFTPLYNAGIDGTGQRVVIAGQTRIQASDLQQFRSKYGLPASDPQVVLVPGSRDPGISTDDLDEAHLDLEWSGAVARNATLVYVYAYDVFTAAQYAIDQNLAPVVSTSYGLCEPLMSTSDISSMRSSAQQANAQGITWFSASGDTGAADCSSDHLSTAAVDFPASLPEVTAVGGTEFQEGDGVYWTSTNSAGSGSALSYIPEIGWNDSAIDGEPSASGGGGSRYFAKPSWQNGPGVPGDNSRFVPDVSLNASADHDGYFVYSQGADAVFGGTSVPAPIYAGLAALLNQNLVAQGKLSAPGLGNINPNLYALAQTTSGVFHDITAGDNIVTVTCPARSRNCTSATLGFSAGAGHDLVTGLGSVDAWQLVSRWAGGSTTAAEPTINLTLQSNLALLSGADTAFLTATAKSSDGSTPSGTVTFTQGSNVLGTAQLAGSAGLSTATLAVAGTQLAQGSGTIAAALNGAPAATLTVTVAPSSAAVPAAPSISAVSNAASFTASYAPGGIVSVFGAQLAQATNVAAVLPLPLALGGVAATVNGVAAPLWYVSPGQINLQIPYQTPAGSATLVINNNGRTSSAILTVSPTAPALFSTPISAARGSTITVYLTGAGTVSPPIANGAAPAAGGAPSALPTPAQTTVTIGNVPGSTTFVGIPPGLVGVVQINVQVPASLGTGTQPIVVTIGGVPSAAGNVTVTP